MIPVLEEKRIYPAWIKDSACRVQVTIETQEDGTIKAKDDNSNRFAIGQTLGEALDKLNELTDDAILHGDL